MYIHFEPDNQTIQSGETAQINITIINDEEQPIDIEMDNSELPKDWTAEFSDKQFQLLPFERKLVFFNITTPIDKDECTEMINVIIRDKHNFDPRGDRSGHTESSIQISIKNPSIDDENISVYVDGEFPLLLYIVFSTITLLLISKFRYFLGKGFLPLYYRKARSQKRTEIYNCINENNGIRKVEIENELGINRGTLSSHLRRLEGKGLIKHAKNKMYYPTSIRTSELTYPQQIVLDIISENEGITPTHISKTLNKSKQFVNYHLTILEHKGYVRKMKGINNTHCYSI